MKTALLAALLIFSSGCATAPPAKPPVHHQGLPPKLVMLLHEKLDPPLDPAVFDSFANAATYAVALSYEKTNTFESSGVVVVRGDMRFQVTQPVTESSGDSVGIPSFKRPGYVVVADYHTHPCLPYTHFVVWFSPEDIEEAEGDNNEPAVGAVMGDFCTGNVHAWAFGTDPVGDHLEHDDDGTPVALTTGRVIGHIALTKRPVVIETPPDPQHTRLLVPVEE